MMLMKLQPQWEDLKILKLKKPIQQPTSPKQLPQELFIR